MARDLKLGLNTGYWAGGPPPGIDDVIAEAEQLGFDHAGPGHQHVFDLDRVDLEVDVVVRDHAWEPLRNALELEEGRVVGHVSQPRVASCRSAKVAAIVARSWAVTSNELCRV